MQLELFGIDLSKYQEQAHRTAIYPTEQRDELVVSAMYTSLGLAGEAGEVAEKVKKWHRDGYINIEALKLEISDVLWYCSELCTILGLDLNDVFEANLDKLRKRHKNNTLQGSGDNR